MPIFSLIYRILLMMLLTAPSVTSMAQTPTLKTSLNRNQILIGETIDLTVEAGNLESVKAIKWLATPDSIQHFEVINTGKVDSVYNSNNKLSGLTQTFTITSFDSGQWRLPAMAVIVQPAVGNVVSYFTDSLPVIVSFANDSTNVIRDIKPILEVEVDDYLWYYIAGGVLIALLIGLGIWWYLKKRVKKPVLFKSKLSPYEEAMEALEQLKKMDLSTTENIKLFYTKLPELLKKFLSRKTDNYHLNKTTSDILLVMKELGVDNGSISNAAASLRLSDAVKFAKFIPGYADNSASLQQVEEFITQAEKQTVTVKR